MSAVLDVVLGSRSPPRAVDAQVLDPALDLVGGSRRPAQICRPRPTRPPDEEHDHGAERQERSRAIGAPTGTWHPVPLEQRDERRGDRCYDAAADDGHDDRRGDAEDPGQPEQRAGRRRRGTTRPGRGRAATVARRTPPRPRAAARCRARRRSAPDGWRPDRRRRAPPRLCDGAATLSGNLHRLPRPALARPWGLHQFTGTAVRLLQRPRPAARAASRRATRARRPRRRSARRAAAAPTGGG